MASHDESSPVMFDLRVWNFAYRTLRSYGVSTVDGVPWIVMERALLSLTGYLDSVGHGNLAYNVGRLLIAPFVPSTVLTLVGPPLVPDTPGVSAHPGICIGWLGAYAHTH
jgi:hypothetical protein